jgi:hypothetical protein
LTDPIFQQHARNLTSEPRNRESNSGSAGRRERKATETRARSPALG